MRITNPCKTCIVQPTCNQMCEKLSDQYNDLRKLQKIMLIVYAVAGLIMVSLIIWDNILIIKQMKHVFGWVYCVSVLLFIITDRKADKVRNKIQKMNTDDRINKFGHRSMTFTTRKAR